jgi:hypothetical protein
VGVFGLMLFKSRRFVEYFPAFALIFLAFSSAPLLRRWASRWVALSEVRPTFLGVGPTPTDKKVHRTSEGATHQLALIVAGVVLVGLMALTLRDARALVADSKPAGLYADAMLFLRQEAAPGTVVFQTDWDDFTRQFFYFSDARYINGLDPTFMQLYDEPLYEEWVDITRGRVESPGAIIRDRFGAAYVVSDLAHEDFLSRAADDPALVEIYRDEDAVVFAVR